MARPEVTGNPFFIVFRNNQDVPFQMNKKDQLIRLAERAGDMSLRYVVDVMFGRKGVVPYFESETIRGALKNIEETSSKERWGQSQEAKDTDIQKYSGGLSQVPTVLKKFLRRPVQVTDSLVDEILDSSEQGQAALRAGMAEMDALFGQLGKSEVEGRKMQIEGMVRRETATLLKRWFYVNTDLGEQLIDEAFAHFFDFDSFRGYPNIRWPR